MKVKGILQFFLIDEIDKFGDKIESWQVFIILTNVYIHFGFPNIFGKAAEKMAAHFCVNELYASRHF